MGYFVGLELSENNRAKAKTAPEIIVTEFPEVSWLSENQLFCVIAYCPAEQLGADRAKQALEEIGANVAPFALTLDRVGCFPAEGPARVAWLGIRELDPQRGMLVRLLEQTQRTLSKYFPIKDQLIPHVPLGRASDRAPKKDLRKFANRIRCEGDPQEVTRVVLVESSKGHKGLNYKIIGSAELSAQFWG